MDDVKKIFLNHCDDKDLIKRFFNENPSRKTVRQLLWDLNTFKLSNNDFFRLVDCCGYLLHTHHSFSRCRSMALQYSNNHIERGSYYIDMLVNYCKFFSLREKIEYLSDFIPEIFFTNIDKFFAKNYPEPSLCIDFVMDMEDMIATYSDKNNSRMDNIYQKRKCLETDITIGDKCFSFIIPKLPTDVLEEARALKICIMARFQQYIKEELIYCFMREKNNIDKHFVSIIIDARSNKILWAIKENHINVDGIELEAVNTWYDTVFKKFFC